MITQKEIENSGWIYSGAMANGGSKIFRSTTKKNHVLTFHGDNFIFKKNKDERLTEIKIIKFTVKMVNDMPTFPETLLYKGNPKNIEALRDKLKSLNIFA